MRVYFQDGRGGVLESRHDNGVLESWNGHQSPFYSQAGDSFVRNQLGQGPTGELDGSAYELAYTEYRRFAYYLSPKAFSKNIATQRVTVGITEA